MRLERVVGVAPRARGRPLVGTFCDVALRALVIANPAAGFRKADPRAEAAVQRLAAGGWRAELYRTTGPGDATRAARDGASGYEIVVAAGGDGTVHEVANGLARPSAAMGVVPLGSMNILARELGIPLEPLAAADWLMRARPSPIALGARGDRYFVLMAGVGYDAFALEGAMARSRRANRKVRFTDYAYVATLGARRYAFPPIAVESEGFSANGAFAIVANCARYGANFRMARRARLEEPRLDLVLYARGAFVHRLGYFLAMLGGVPEWPRGVTSRKVEAVRLRSQDGRRVPVQMDGEMAEPLPAEFFCVPDALHLLRSPGAP